MPEDLSIFCKTASMLYIYNIILHNHKKGYHAICHNMNGHRGYYAMWNKSDWEKQIPHGFTHM